MGPCSNRFFFCISNADPFSILYQKSSHIQRAQFLFARDDRLKKCVIVFPNKNSLGPNSPNVGPFQAVFNHFGLVKFSQRPEVITALTLHPKTGKIFGTCNSPKLPLTYYYSNSIIDVGLKFFNGHANKLVDYLTWIFLKSY